MIALYQVPKKRTTFFKKTLHSFLFLYIIAYVACEWQAGMAQLVEQLIRNQQVVGSSPISSFSADIYQVSAFFIS